MAKYYAVKNGRQPGIYTTWDECKAQVDGYPNAKFKSFKTDSAAQEYMSVESTVDVKKDTPVEKSEVSVMHTRIAKPSDKHIDIYVDGSYNSSTNQYGCGVYMIDATTGKPSVILANGQCMDGGRNVEGEVFATIHAVDFAFRQGYQSMCIYHDYQGIGSWADKEWSANKGYTRNYAEYIDTLRLYCTIDFKHVDGHTGNSGNECVDKLAKLACDVPLKAVEKSELKDIISSATVYNHTKADMSDYSSNVVILNDLSNRAAEFYSDGNHKFDMSLDVSL